ncbi:hypothetical protein LOTGIDRAFT_233276 [Lottia gigantea]|uniref:Uncharacterized protein n=1 Tax=Lottia gigantea TaxID=225164 RepID=V3ZKV3_LOTGI|nr:hypothetical protein LOTGIDRAFT_233276 [Lottia gigantea]ESO91988.1 hypothetical protein LOTGIDRAFT_233276 [Lottia gigantea]
MCVFFFFWALLFCQSNGMTTKTPPSTTRIAVIEFLLGQNDTLTDANTTDTTTTESPATTTENQTPTSATLHPNLPETTSAVYVQGDSGIENGSKNGTDVTTDKDVILVSTSPALNDVSQVNKITAEIPQGQYDTHLTVDRFSQTIETTTEQSLELTTELIDKIIESTTSKNSTIRPNTSTSTTLRNTPSEYLHVENKDTVGRSYHPGSSSEQSGVVIIGAVLAFFCVAILVAVVLVFRRRRQSEKQKVMMNFDLNRMDLRSLRHQPPNVVTVNFPLKPEADLWQDVKPMNSSVI